MADNGRKKKVGVGQKRRTTTSAPKAAVAAASKRRTPARGVPAPPPAAAAEVRTLHHVIVCSYPWLGEPASFGSGPEHGSQHGVAGDGGASWRTLPQNTPEYGRRMVAWLSARNVDIVTGFWSGDPARPCIEHFDASLGALPAAELGTLRLADMFALDPPLDAVELAIEGRGPRMMDARYARITDAAGAARVPIFLRGALGATGSSGAGPRRPADFRGMIERLRALFASRLDGASPFFIGSHHLLSPPLDDVIGSLDAVYRDGCAQAYDETGHPATMSTAEAVTPTRAAWAADLAALEGKTAFASGLPVYYIVGSAPAAVGRDDPRRGAVVAQHKDQIALMFAALRDDARTLREARAGDGATEVHKWVALTSAADWAAQSAIEPCLVRADRSYREVTAWGYDYGTDAIDLIGDLFRPEIAAAPAPVAAFVLQG
jgi:hypothetical protein